MLGTSNACLKIGYLLGAEAWKSLSWPENMNVTEIEVHNYQKMLKFYMRIVQSPKVYVDIQPYILSLLIFA